jgi:hypothetical protein
MEAIFVYGLVVIFFLLFLLSSVLILLHPGSQIAVSMQTQDGTTPTINDKAVYALLVLLFIGLYGYAFLTMRKTARHGSSA